MPRILLACPDPDARVIFGSVLEHAGYDVVSLDDADRLVALAAGCALVITDFPTPVGGASTVTRLLRTHASTVAVPILNATTHVMPDELEAARAAGVTETFVLPGDPRHIVERVRALVGAP